MTWGHGGGTSHDKNEQANQPNTLVPERVREPSKLCVTRNAPDA